MKTETIEFNAFKTIKLINKETLLKSVYNASQEDFNYMALKKAVDESSLSPEKIASLKNIFDNIIQPKKLYSSQYVELEAKESTPRRYGKVQILADIATQGGIPTNEQTMMLSLNDLKSMFLNLHNKGTSDHFKGTTKLSEADARVINAAVLTFKKKISPILKRKR